MQSLTHPEQNKNSKSLSWYSDVYLTNIFGNDFLNSIPTIETSNGSTDYLDRIKPENFYNNTVPVCLVKGIDAFKRHFVSFGIEINDESGKVMEHAIYTLFRRYTDPNSIWVMCKSHYSESQGYIFNNIFEYSMMVTDEARNHLINLIKDFKNENIGLTLPCEIFNSTTMNYDNVLYTVKLYHP